MQRYLEKEWQKSRGQRNKYEIQRMKERYPWWKEFRGEAVYSVNRFAIVVGL